MKRINAFLLGISIAAIVSCDNIEEGGLPPNSSRTDSVYP